MLNLCVDIHGVLTDYVAGFCGYHEILLYNGWPKGEYDIEKVTGKHWSTLPVEEIAQLPQMPDFMSIMKILAKHRILFITTAKDEEKALATVAWVKNRVYPAGVAVCDEIKAHAMEIAHIAASVLIDDSDVEVNAWRQFGGKAILLPRPWNTAVGDPLEVLEEQLFMIECDLTSGR